MGVNGEGKNGQRILEDIMTENFPNMANGININI